MTQQWGPPPDYPAPRPSRPPYQLMLTEPDHYSPGDPPLKRGLFFVGGSCFALAIVNFCVCVLALLWIVDNQWDVTIARSDEVNAGANPYPAFPPPQNPPFVQPTAPLAPQPELAPAQSQAPTPTPGPRLPVPIGQPVLANDIGVELTVWDIQRNVQPINVQVPDGTEFVAVSVQLNNIDAAAPQSYVIDSFYLQDDEDTVFTPNAEADNGRRLRNGEIPPGKSVEGDLLFHVPLGHTPLTLVWQAAGSAETFLVKLQ